MDGTQFRADSRLDDDSAPDVMLHIEWGTAKPGPHRAIHAVSAVHEMQIVAPAIEAPPKPAAMPAAMPKGDTDAAKASENRVPILSQVGYMMSAPGLAGTAEAVMIRSIAYENKALIKPLLTHPVSFLKSDTNQDLARGMAVPIAALAAVSLARDTWALAHPHQYTKANELSNLRSVIADGITLAGAVSAFCDKTRFLSMPIEAFGLSMRAAQGLPPKIEPSKH